MMQITIDRDERRKQKELLRSLYPDYDPKKHDAFVMIYNNEVEKQRVTDYMKNRGLVD